MRTDLYVEFEGSSTDTKSITDMAKEIWKAEGNKVKDLESLELFFKPAEKKCYYIFNGEIKGDFEVIL